MHIESILVKGPGNENRYNYDYYIEKAVKGYMFLRIFSHGTKSTETAWENRSKHKPEEYVRNQKYSQQSGRDLSLFYFLNCTEANN